jgi:Spy/CpxP family protein refolding chaperone
MTRQVFGWLLAATVAWAISAPVAALPAHDRSQTQQTEKRRHKWWQDQRLKAELELTEQQAQEVEQIFQSMIPRLRVLKDQLDQLEKDLSRMIAERTAQESTVAQAIDRVERTRGELNKQRQLMLYRMHRVLSAEQNARLRSIFEREHPDRKENRQR